jgi:surfactin synthase thioesterase subunit
VCPVELPGHGTRFSEPLHTALSPLVCRIASALTPRMDGEFALFGHSMGTLIAFELAHVLRYVPVCGPFPAGVSNLRLRGLQDPEAGHDDLRAWQEQTSAAFRLRMLEGDHFFLRSGFPILRDAIVDDLLRTHSSPGGRR